MRRLQSTSWAGYVVAGVGAVVGIGLYVLLANQEPVFRLSLAFGTLYLGVALAAYFGGTRPAILASLLGCVVAEYLFVHPYALLSASAFRGILIVVLYLLSCALIVAHTEARRQAAARAESLETAIRAKQRRLGAEIADREAAEAAARLQAERFRIMADSAPVLIWMSGSDKKFNWYNKPWLEFVGRTLEQEQGADWGDSIHDDDYDRSIEAYERAFAERKPFSLEYRLRRHDGVYRWVLDDGVPLYDADGSFNGFIGSCVDITERKEAEAQARAASEKAAQVLESIHDVFLALDRENRYTYVNAAGERYYGKTREEMLGKTPWEVFPVYALEQNKDLMVRLLDRSQPQVIEVKSLVTGRWVQSSSYPTEEGISYFIRDVTERKLAAEAVESKEAQLQLITHAVPAMIAYVDQQGSLLFANRAYAEWLGMEPDEVAGKPIRELLEPGFHALARPHVDAALSGQEAAFEAVAEMPGGENRWLQVHLVPDFGTEGEVRGFVTLIHDVSEDRHIQETLRYQGDLLRTITENAHSMLVMLDAAGKVTFANAACAETIGLRPEELVGLSFHAVAHHTGPDGSPYPAEQCPICRPHPSPESLHNLEETIVSKNGSFIPVRYSASRIVRGTETIATVLELHDITDERRSRAALEESEARFQSFMDHSPAFSWIKDHEGKYIFVNKALAELNGWRAGDWQGKTDFDIYPRELAAVYRANDEVVLADGRVRQFSETVYEKGITRQLLAIKFPMRVGDGKWNIGGMAIDVTESIRAEEALRASEARFQAFMEYSPALAWIKNQTGQYVFVNRAMRKTFGWGLQSSSRKTDVELFPSEIAERLRSNDEAVLKKGDVIEFVEVLPSLSGPRHFLVVSFPMRVGEGQWHIGGKAIDITDRVEAEEALARSERELNDFFENAAIGLHWIGPDGVIQRANRTQLQMLGYSREEYVGHPIRDFHENPEVSDRLLASLREGHSVENCPTRLLCKDGTFKDVLVTTNGLMERGELVHSRSFMRDVTSETRALEALRDSEERFRVLAESLPSIVWTAAPDGTITYANKHWLEYCGLTAEANARGWPELVLHPDDYDRCVSQWTQALQDGAEYEIEVRNRRYDGEYRWFVTRATPIRDESGKVKSWFGVTTDIHDQKMLQEQLREADRRKDEFLATLAHELRNPLAPIRNAVQLLRSGELSSTAANQSVEIIDRQISQMVRLVDDLLEASRVSRGKLALRKAAVDLRTAVESAVASSRHVIDAMGHRLEIDLPSEPVWLYADSFRLSQIFSNLLNNAAKYTEPGGRINLTVLVVGDKARISFRDTGMGIEKEVLPHIFDMFFQGRSALERIESGLGIGLSLVRTLVSLHEGTIEAKSDGPGKGSEFVVTLPIGVPDGIERGQAVVEVEDGETRQELRIVVVDDNVDSAHTLSMLLNLMGHRTETALDGLEAIRVIDRFRPDVVLLDIGLPEINGYDVARKVREKPWGKDIQLVALSGWGQDSDKLTAREAGFDHHLTKPVDFTTLEKLLRSLTVRRQV